MNCKACQRVTPSCELACYGGRCEACWLGPVQGRPCKTPLYLRVTVLDGYRIGPGKYQKPRHG